MQVILENRVVSYETHGKQSHPVALLLHGWGDSKDTFSKLQLDLAKKYYVVSVDLPGFGGSDNPQETYSLEKYAQFLQRFLEKLNIDQKRLHLIVGHSNGGAIAIKALSSGLLQSSYLVLLASSGVRATYKARKKALRLLAKTAKLPTKLLPKAAQERIKKRVYNAIGSDLFVAEDLQDTFKNVVSEDIVDQAASVHAKTLLLYGDHDTATPPAYGRKIAEKIKGSRLVVIENAEHFLHQSHASQVNREIMEFVA